MFAAHAQSALNVERSLHEAYFAAWGLAPEEVAATPPTPTTLAYTSYLLRVAGTAPFEEIIGALLPCYWIYWEVGKRLVAQGSPHAVYQRWIDAYASEQFASAVGRCWTSPNRSTARPAPAEPAGDRDISDGEPLRVDVLGRGLSSGSLARLTGRVEGMLAVMT